MPGGLVALLDDIAALAKMAAASLDDVAGAAAQASAKAAGVVIDDAAVTPAYVIGLTPDRELPVIGKIALGSLRNKLVVLLPAALLLSALAPWAITPLLVVGGSYLCFEGSEKIIAALGWGGHGDDAPAAPLAPIDLERSQVASAVHTDFILSGEIMAIALAELEGRSLLAQAAALAGVALAMTAGVYGVVALIVKMDDIGLMLARRKPPVVRALGRLLARGMPVLLEALSGIGTFAMLWVGGGIILHALENWGAGAPMHLLHALSKEGGAAMPFARAALDWVIHALGAALFGLTIGGVIAAGVHALPRSRS